MRTYISKKTGFEVAAYDRSEFQGKTALAVKAWDAAVQANIKAKADVAAAVAAEAGVPVGTVAVFMMHGAIHVTTQEEPKAKKAKGATVSLADWLKAQAA